MRVSFNLAQEFIDELKKSQPEAGVVRLTYTAKPTSLTPNIKHVNVVGTFVSDSHVVRLDAFCGYTCGIEKIDSETQEKSVQVMKELEEACKSLGLEVRAGVFDA